MGGKVAMRYAADYGDDLAALVIEDMDTGARKTPSAGWNMRLILCVQFSAHYPVHLTTDRPPMFDRACGSWEECRAQLVQHGYEEERVQSWKGQRVFPVADGSWWSNINPTALFLGRYDLNPTVAISWLKLYHTFVKFQHRLHIALLGNSFSHNLVIHSA